MRDRFQCDIQYLSQKVRLGRSRPLGKICQKFACLKENLPGKNLPLSSISKKNPGLRPSHPAGLNVFYESLSREGVPTHGTACPYFEGPSRPLTGARINTSHSRARGSTHHTHPPPPSMPSAKPGFASRRHTRYISEHTLAITHTPARSQSSARVGFAGVVH